MAYSLDLRRLVVDAYNDGEGTVRELAVRFKVTKDTVSKWVRLEAETGSLEPRTASNRRPLKLSEPEQELLLQMARNDPDATLQELADALLTATGTKLSGRSVSEYLKRAGLTRKKRRLWLQNNAPPRPSTDAKSTSKPSSSSTPRT